MSTVPHNIPSPSSPDKMLRPASPRATHEPTPTCNMQYSRRPRAQANPMTPRDTIAHRVVREVEAVAGHHAESGHQRRRPSAQQQQHGDARPAQRPQPKVVQEHRGRACSCACHLSESSRRRTRRCFCRATGPVSERRGGGGCRTAGGCVSPSAQSGKEGIQVSIRYSSIRYSSTL